MVGFDETSIVFSNNPRSYFSASVPREEYNDILSGISEFKVDDLHENLDLPPGTMDVHQCHALRKERI